MSGSVLRLTIVLVFSTLPNYSVLQHPESLIQNPFSLRIKSNFLREFMKRRDEIFPFSFSTTSKSFYSTNSPTLPDQFLDQQFDYLNSPSSNTVVKRKIPRDVLENERVQNFIRDKMKNQTKPERGERDQIIPERVETNPLETKNPVYQNDYVANDNLSEIIILDFKKPSSVKLNTDVRLIPAVNDEFNSVIPSAEINAIKGALPPRISTPLKKDPPKKDEGTGSKISFLGYVISTLTQLPVIGNVLRASVDPLYRPLIRHMQPDNETSMMRGEIDMKNWCFGILGCIQPTEDFFHPLYRPVNLPPYSREQIATAFTIHSRNATKGYSVPAMVIEDIVNTTFTSTKPTKFIIHGYLNDRHQTWVWEMVRGLLHHGDYNVITVDWSGGSHALYSQATANIRVASLEVARLLNWMIDNLELDPSTVHIIGHSLGAHTAGYVGARVRGIGRITGLDPAEPFFQYMPDSVRLDPSDALFVDIIHTDTDSFFAITGPRGFGLQQPVGHIDFYPNGGKDQPGCNQLLARVPMTLISEGADIIEGINAAQTELMNCDHVRSAKLFTDSLTSGCPYLSFECSSYEKYKEGKCFNCGKGGRNCSFMGINADNWEPQNRTHVKMFLDTHFAPNFCKYHYLLTVNFADTVYSKGTLRGRLKISFINENENLKKFDLTALSPIKFPRRGSRTFMIEHFEDLSGAQEALINWTFESDLLDPMTFCVLFCKADLTIATMSLLSVDSHQAASKVVKMRSGLADGDDEHFLNGGEIIMCHKKGERFVSIRSETTVKISASPSCSLVRRTAQVLSGTHPQSSHVQKVAFEQPVQ